jgi:hypothetical protein
MLQLHKSATLTNQFHLRGGESFSLVPLPRPWVIPWRTSPLTPLIAADTTDPRLALLALLALLPWLTTVPPFTWLWGGDP